MRTLIYDLVDRPYIEGVPRSLYAYIELNPPGYLTEWEKNFCGGMLRQPTYPSSVQQRKIREVTSKILTEDQTEYRYQQWLLQ